MYLYAYSAYTCDNNEEFKWILVTSWQKHLLHRTCIIKLNDNMAHNLHQNNMITWYTYVLHMKSVLEHKLELSMKLSQLQNSRWEWTYNKDVHVQRSNRRNIRKNKQQYLADWELLTIQQGLLRPVKEPCFNCLCCDATGINELSGRKKCGVLKGCIITLTTRPSTSLYVVLVEEMPGKANGNQ